MKRLRKKPTAIVIMMHRCLLPLPSLLSVADSRTPSGMKPKKFKSASRFVKMLQLNKSLSWLRENKLGNNTFIFRGK